MSGKTKEPSVSFVIVSYNCADLIADCINSVRMYGAESIVVVDNASMDGTRDILLSYKDNICLILNEKNLGYTVACNQGIQASNTEYIFLLNPDAYLKDESWKLMLPVINANPGIGAIAPNLYYPNGDLQNYIRRFPSISALLVEFFIPAASWNRFPAYRTYTCMDLDLSQTLELEQPAGAALLFPAGALMDERFFIYGSDLELCNRIRKSGKKILLQPNAAVFHHQSKGGTGAGNPLVRAWLQLDALYGYGLYFRENRGYFYYLLFRCFFAAGLLMTALAGLGAGAAHRTAKWTRLKGFLANRNFKYFLNQ